MKNIEKALNIGSEFLKENFIISYQLDSELLLGKILNKNREYLFLNNKQNLNEEIIDKFKILLNRRKKKEPVAYILKCKEFWKNTF